VTVKWRRATEQNNCFFNF